MSESVTELELPWLTESLRLTVFCADASVDTEKGWWRSVVGELPEVRTVQRNGPVLHEHGVIRDGYCILSLDYQLGRIDWVFAPVVPDPQKIDRVPQFGPQDKAIGVFREILTGWLRGAPPYARIALGGVFVIPVENKEAGYKTIQEYLPSVKIDPENSSDFLYQINRPRQSLVLARPCRINRLSKWSVMQVHPFQVLLSFSPIAASPMQVTGPGFSAVRVELDINTAAENADLIPIDASEPLLGELVSFTQEILQRGDVS